MRLAPIAALLLIFTAAPALAQGAPASLSPRVDKLEKEMRAVQRKVFPGGAGNYFEPEIAPQAPVQAPVGIPSATPVAELTSRVDALEKELSRMTGQVEQNQYRLTQLEAGLAKLRAETDTRIKALGTPAPAAAIEADPVVTAPPAKAPGKTAATKPTPPAKAPAATDATVGVTTSGDAGEDAYMAGYKLWTEMKYPEAQAALKAVVAKYPKHKRASYAQNLLGRAYLDDGKPAMAAEAFYANYQKMPRGERAPDSLYYLGQSLMSLKKPAEACKVYDELTDVYGATIAEPLKGRVAKARTDAKCS